MRTPNDWTPFATAIVANDCKKVRRLVGDACVDALDFRQRTPCMLAVEMNSTDALAELLTHGYNSSVRGAIALDVAVYTGNVHAAEICLNGGCHGMMGDCTKEVCWDPLLLAVQCNQVGMVKLLLNHNFKKRCIHNSTPTPVDIAVMMGHPLVLSALLERDKSDSSQSGCQGLDPPIFLAVKASSFKEGHLKCFKQLIENCSDFASLKVMTFSQP